MIDDMEGLFTHASEAYRAGKRSGRDDYYRVLQDELRRISVEQEKQTDDLATRGFHVAQACCKAASDLKIKMDESLKQAT